MEALIYTWTYCPYCVRAKQILERNEIPYDERVMDGRHAELAEIKAKYNHYTVPIIILDGCFIGGCDELGVKERAGQLH